MSKRQLPDIALMIDGGTRQDLAAVKRNYPVAQVTIVAAAVSRFRRLPVDEQVEEIRKADQARRRNRRTTAA